MTYAGVGVGGGWGEAWTSMKQIFCQEYVATMPFCLQMAIVHGSGRPWKAMEGGIEFHDVKHALLGLEFSRTVRTRAGDVVKAGAQVLDRQWRSLKDYLPKTLATKSKAGHVNQSLWQWTYSWQYRYNNGKYLWTAVPHVLKHIRNA